MSEQMRILNKIDLSDLASIVGKNGESTKELIATLTALIAILSEKKEPVVNFDVAALAEAINAKQQPMPEFKMPEVNVTAPSIDLKAAVNEIEMRREAQSYEFNIKRGSDGKIASVIANPIGVRS